MDDSYVYSSGLSDEDSSNENEIVILDSATEEATGLSGCNEVVNRKK